MLQVKSNNHYNTIIVFIKLFPIVVLLSYNAFSNAHRVLLSILHL